VISRTPYNLIEFVSSNEKGILVKRDTAGNKLAEKGGNYSGT